MEIDDLNDNFEENKNDEQTNVDKENFDTMKSIELA